MSQLVPYYAAPPPVPAFRPPGSGLATSSLVLGVLSVVFCWWGLATLAMVVLSITFGAVSLRRAAEYRWPRPGTGVAGLVLGIVGGAIYLALGMLSFGAMFLI
jgi:hypothetical protein